MLQHFRANHGVKDPVRKRQPQAIPQERDRPGRLRAARETLAQDGGVGVKGRHPASKGPLQRQLDESLA